MIATSCTNPLLSKIKPYETIPFHELKQALPSAFKEAMEVHLAEIDAIVNNPSKFWKYHCGFGAFRKFVDTCCLTILQYVECWD